MIKRIAAVTTAAVTLAVGFGAQAYAAVPPGVLRCK